MLAACQQSQGEILTADDFESAAVMVLTPSPDIEGAKWSITEDELGIQFGKDSTTPILSLECEPSDEHEPLMTVIRHAKSEPGAKALFAVIGNGIAARMKLDAVLADGGWRWEGTLPAKAGEFDVFTGPRAIEATLPGAGTVKLPAAKLPREFVGWCRRNGEDLPSPEPVSSPAPG